ncbi:MAG: histidinol-phosphatase [Bacilli bacterium]|jgi:histidinol-phosphatase (PHP family)|nr:histidinol-phosphatase [Bacillota bacterium]NLM32436.1 histidinol-phosphatase [Acholeplasmataceae bacterium]HOA78785.1 histidinol-phosphatase [Bacilli bacterium]HPZ27292.1 histidinol-phosphatase [Bacilli bacterium]HQC89686.1 histidinol-phosphatase [Bacilli bacterium]
MIDAHVHIEFGEYAIEYIERMVDKAREKGITEIWVLDHTHKFLEFKPVYEIIRSDAFNRAWYDRKRPIPLADFLELASSVKKRSYPVTVKFGLEVCYFEEKEEELRGILREHDFDFLIGSVHFIDGFGFDLSRKNWEGKDVNRLYRRYYEITESLIKSGLFTALGHPDAIKLFEKYPDYPLADAYRRVAALLKERGMATENNSGLSRYGFPYPGLNPEFLRILKETGVVINRASDAHNIDDIGRMFERLEI